MPKRNGGPVELTPRQRAWLRAVAVLMDRHGVGPTYDDLSRAMRRRGGPPLARNAAASMVRLLERKGLLARLAGRHRSIRLTAAGAAASGRA